MTSVQVLSRHYDQVQPPLPAGIDAFSMLCAPLMRRLEIACVRALLAAMLVAIAWIACCFSIIPSCLNLCSIIIAFGSAIIGKSILVSGVGIPIAKTEIAQTRWL